MPVFIDDQPYELIGKKNLLEIAIAHGLDLPFFCWHPALGSIGACRVCAVQKLSDEKDTDGHIAMACMTEVKDGDRFSIDHENCHSFRKQVIEWLMINHPHDCPVCDEGGECHLQDMTVMSGHNYRRYRFSKRTFHNQDLGPLIKHEMNRCIACYRCVRFYRNVAHGNDLDVFSISGDVYFGRFENGSLNSPFSGNLVEVCPTGVFTDKPYHHRYVRKWDLRTAPSICQLCSLGCNISPAVRENELLRVHNRYHRDINGYFICDRGRFGHEYVNSSQRLLHPLLSQGRGFKEISYPSALEEFAHLFRTAKKIAGITSHRASLEDNWLLKKLVGADNFYTATSDREYQANEELKAALRNGLLETASLDQIRKSDLLLVVGEDLINTAPMAFLSIHQAEDALKGTRAEQDLSLGHYCDSAIRDYSRENLLPIFTIHAFETALDTKACSSLLCHPSSWAHILSALSKRIIGMDLIDAMPNVQSRFIEEVAIALKKAQRPVVVAGTSLGDRNVMRAAISLTAVLDCDEKKTAALFPILPGANSLGHGLLDPKPISRLLPDPHGHHHDIDLLLVLKNDLFYHLGQSSSLQLLRRSKRVVVIDSSITKTAEGASLVIPCPAFHESTGTMVNNQGRLQQYFAVAKVADAKMRSVSDILTTPMDEAARAEYSSPDSLFSAMAQDLGITPEQRSHLYGPDFLITGQKIPRDSIGYSGRTALESTHTKKVTMDTGSPFSFSMEGARKKIPLPLISSYQRPGYNSVQAAFKSILKNVPDDNVSYGGIRLFKKNEQKRSLPGPMPPGDQELTFNELYVIPYHHIFSFEEAEYCPSLKSLLPKILARISRADAERLKLREDNALTIDFEKARIDVAIKVENGIHQGLLLLPHGLMDPELFFKRARIAQGEVGE